MDMFARYKSSSPRKPRAVLQIVHIELASIEPSEAARKKNTNREDDDRPVPGPLRRPLRPHDAARRRPAG